MRLIKGSPEFYGIFRMQSDGNAVEAEMSVNNRLNIWLFKDPRNVATAEGEWLWELPPESARIIFELLSETSTFWWKIYQFSRVIRPIIRYDITRVYLSDNKTAKLRMFLILQTTNKWCCWVVEVLRQLRIHKGYVWAELNIWWTRFTIWEMKFIVVDDMQV